MRVWSRGSVEGVMAGRVYGGAGARSNVADTDAPDVVSQSREWQEIFYEAMVPFALAESLQNFPDPSLTDWARAY